MLILVYFFIFFFGLSVGSFLNCVIYRMELQENMPEDSPKRKETSFLRGKSFCPHCQHTLNWQDLIPLLSFFILKGRCRYCQKPISWQYPFVELATGIIFLLILLTNPYINIYTGVYLLIMSCFLIVIFVYDLKHYLIPDKFVYPAIAVALIFNFQFLISKQFLIFKFSMLSAFGAAAFFLFFVLVSSGRWMGVGDIKLSFLMGLILGWPNIFLAIFSASLIGAIIGVGLILFGRKTLKSEIPFGPFLVFGTFISLFFGNQIISAYFNLF